MNNINLEYKKLFDNKKFTELIFKIETETQKTNLSAGLLNLLGVSRLLKGAPKEEDYLESLENFEKAYLKENKTSIGLQSLKNFINVSADFYSNFDNLLSFENAFKYFKEARAYFDYDRELINAIIRVHKRCNNINEIINLLSERIKNLDHRTDTICSYIYHNCLKDDWNKKDFFNYGKFLDEKIPKYSNDQLKPIGKLNKKKIRLGFVSADIRSSHSITHFLKTILLNYNKNEFEIFLYLNINREDETANQYKRLVDKTVNIFNLNDIDAINIIRADCNDILLDLMGVTGFHRIALFKNRLASIQISWLGYCNTSGLKEMDYIISDPNLIYPEEENLYTEKVIYLKNIWNTHVGFNINRMQNISPAQKNQYITFGSFNNFNKINDNVINTWSNILRVVKNSKLILKPSSKQDTSRLKKLFEKNSILNSVIFYENIKNFDEHLKLYAKIDIALDTFPYNGVTTSFEAIWMNIPILTMKGYNFNSRCGESINKNIKMTELIATDENDYIEIAVKLSTNINYLTQIRNKIYLNALSSPLFNTKVFSEDFFDAMKNVYNEY